MIDKYITNVCDILNINEPSVSYDTSNFQSDTMMAQCNSFGSTIYLYQKDKPDPDYLFSIAHELRHVWQIRTNKQLYFSDYKTVDLIDIEKYNNQLAEVDANAFATVVMVNFFHLQPQYHGLSKYTIRLIKQRIEWIFSQLIE